MFINPVLQRSRSLASRSHAVGRKLALVTGVVAVAALASACGSSSTTSSSSGSASTTGSGSSSAKAVKLAFFSFAVQNSFDAAMLTAIKKEAAASNTSVQVFDANNSSQTQYSQIQDALASGKYNAFLIQPVVGASLVPLVQKAIAQHVEVGTVNQVLGSNLATAAVQVPGVAVSIVQVNVTQGENQANLVVQACASLKANPCKVGFFYDIKASSYDQGLRAGFDQVLAKHPSIRVVAEGQDEYTASGGLTAAQSMISANPDINVMVGSDQGMQGATSAIKSSGKHILVVGAGGSVPGLAHVKDGSWFGDVVEQPATQAQTATQELIQAVRTGKHFPGADLSTKLANKGLVTQATAGQYSGQWAG